MYIEKGELLELSRKPFSFSIAICVKRNEILCPVYCSIYYAVWGG